MMPCPVRRVSGVINKAFMQKIYKEKIPFKGRMFSLYEDRIEISGKNHSGNYFESTIPLKGIRLPKDTVYMRDNLKMFCTAIPGALCMLLVIVFSNQIIRISELLYFISLAICLFLVGFGIIYSKKNKFYIYLTIAGIPAFDLSECGNKIEEFESFCKDIDLNVSINNK